MGILKWNRHFSGSGSFSYDKAFGVTDAGDGGVVAVGKRDTGTWYSAWAVKRDSDGGTVWSKTFGSKGLNQFKDVILDSNGNYVMVGQVFSGYHYKGWLVALDKNGNSKGSKSYNKSGTFDAFKGMTEVPGGGYAVTGCYHFEAIADDDYMDQGRMWLVRLSSSYGFQWHKTFSGRGWSEGYAIATMPDGGFVLVGYTLKKGGARDAYVVRTDSTGKKIWDFISGWPNQDVARDVYVTPKGIILVTGYGVVPGARDYDAFVIALDDQGKVLWKRFYGFPGSTDAGYSIAPFPGDEKSFIVGGKHGLKGLLIKINLCEQTQQ